MTRFAATIKEFAEWGETIEREIDETQALASLPEDARSFPLLRAQEVMELTGATEWNWKSFVKQLKDEDRILHAGPQNRITLEQAHELMESLGKRPRRPDGIPRAMRIAIENFKGGAGKSTASLHIAVSLGMKGYRVLVVDTDPQATLSRLFGVQPWKLGPEETIAAAAGAGLDGAAPTRLMPRPTYIDGISIIPGSMGLSQVELEIIRRFRDREVDGIERIFDDALAEIDDQFDIVLMDFQPSFSMTQLLLLWAMDGLLIPLPTETADFAGTGDFLQQAAAFMEPVQNVTGRPKVWDPVLIVHTKRKRSGDLVYNMSGAVFGEHRPPEHVDDSLAVSASLATLKSVFEAGAETYDLRALKRAREQYNGVTERLIEAIQERWGEMLQATPAQGGRS